MSAKSVDIATMLDELNLPLAAARWNEIWDAPEMADYTLASCSVRFWSLNTLRL